MSIKQTHTLTVDQDWKTGSATVEIELRSRTLFGMAVTPYPGSGRTHSQEVAAHETDCGKARILRTYDGGLPANWYERSAASGSHIPGFVPGAYVRGSWHSMKPDVFKLGSGELDDWAREYVTSIPATGHTRMLTIWHEPEAKIKDGRFTAAQWVKANLRFARIVREVGHPDVEFGPCFMSRFTLGTRAYDVPSIVERGDPLFDLVDFVGFDPYNEASKSGDYTKDVAYYLDPIVEWRDDYAARLPIAIGETGFIPDPANPSARAHWLTDFADYAEAHRFAAVCYFDASVGNPWWLRCVKDSAVRDEASIKAWREVGAR